MNIDSLFRLHPDRDVTVLILFMPFADILIFFFETFQMITVLHQIDRSVFFVQRHDDRVFYKRGFQFGIEKHVLYRTGNVLILTALRDGKLSELRRQPSIIAENNIPVLFILLDLPTIINLTSQGLADLIPAIERPSFGRNEIVFAIRDIQKTKAGSSLRTESHHQIASFIPPDFIDYV